MWRVAFLNSYTHVYTTAGCERPRAVSVDSLKGAATDSQSAHRELVPTYPHQVYHLLLSHLRNTASSVISKVGLSPSSQFDQCLHECNLNNFSRFESTSSHCLRDRAHGRRAHAGYIGMCSDPVDPGGGVRSSSVGCTIGMWDISPLVLIIAAGRKK